MTLDPDDSPRLHAVPGPDDVPATRGGHYDLKAERIVLGAMMLSADAADEVADIVRAHHFYRTTHGAIFSAIVSLRNHDEPTDPVAVARALAAAGDLGRVGGGPYLANLIECVPVAASAGYHAQKVAEEYHWRELGDAGARIARIVEDRGMDLSEARNKAQAFIHEATMADVRSEYRRFQDILTPAIDRIEAAAEQTGPLGLPTGIRDLDAMLEGLRDGQLVIVAGRPGMGKSVFAVDVARHTAMKRNKPAIVFSLEMSEAEIMNRVLSAETGLPLRALEKGTLSDGDWSKLGRRAGEIEKAPLFLDDSPTLDLAEIRGKARRLKQRHDLGLVVVDYLQLMSSPRKTENRALEVGELSRGLKLLAKEVECPVIAASQLNRNSENRADRRPQLSDLRESGAVEQDADIVILLHRDAYYDPQKRPGEVDLIVAKNRNGPLGSVVAAAQLHCTRIVDMAIP